MKRAAWSPSALACAALALFAAGFEGWVRSGSPSAEVHTKALLVAILTTNLCVVGVGAFVAGLIAAPVGSIASWVFWRLTRHRLAIAAQGGLLGYALVAPVEVLHGAQGIAPLAVAIAVGVGAAYGIARADFRLTAEWGLGSKLLASGGLLIASVVALLFVRADPVRLELATFEGSLSGRIIARALRPKLAPQELDPLAGTAAGLATLVAGSDKIAVRPNLLLITIDGLRSDHLTLGARREVMPKLEALARRGVVFSRAYAITPTCAPSLATLLTGEPPHVHGVWHDQQRPSVANLFSWLAETHDTAAFFIGHASIPDLTSAAGSVVAIEGLGPKDLLLDWISSPRTKPAFTWVHIGGPTLMAPDPDTDRFRSPADPLPYFAVPSKISKASGRADLGRIRDVYAAKLLAADGVLGEILGRLEQADAWGSTIAIVTSDHGFALGEHERFGVGLTLFEEEIRVPLVFAGGRIAGYPAPPKSTEVRSGRSSDVLVSLMDVAPTIIDLAGLAPVPTAGRSLSAALRGGAVEPYAWLPALIPDARDGRPKVTAAIGAKEKLIVRGAASSVFDLVRDRNEENNVWGARDKRDDRLSRSLHGWRGAWSSGADVGRADARFSSLR